MEVRTVAPVGEPSAGPFRAPQRAEEERDPFFTLSLDLLCIAGFDGYFKRLNPAWENALGWSAAQLLAEPFLNFVHVDDRDRTRAEAENLAAGKRTVAFENRYRCMDGTYRWLLWNAVPYPEQRLIYGAARDITGRKRAEEEIQKINAFLDSIVENIPNMVFVKDAATLRFERINKAGEKLLGYRREDLIGKNDYDFFPREQADFFIQKDREVLDGREVMDITEEEIKTKDGRRIIHTSKLPIFDDQGKPRYLLGISEDITARRALEETRRKYAEAKELYTQELERKHQALTKSERRYRQLTESSLDGIIVADQDSRIVLFNPAAEKMFGYQSAEVRGQPISLLMPAAFLQAHERGFQRYLQTRRPVIIGRTVEMTGRRKDGTEFPLELALSAADVGGDLQFQGAVRDLTERNRMRLLLLQTEKLASIGLLSAGMAHEINNPLSYVANNLVVLERDVKGLMDLVEVYESARDDLSRADPETARHARELAEHMDLPYIRDNLDRILTRTREGVQRVAKIVQSLRGLARTERPKMEEANIPDLVESNLDMVRGRMQRHGIKIELDYGATPKLCCVPTQIGQVVLNLLINASQAVEAVERRDRGRVKVSTRCEDGGVVIEVADNGCGIDPKELPRIFDPFYTTKPVGEGTGMGLSISHGIVTGHGGRIEVESRPGEGTCFRVFLPLDPQ